MTDLYCKLLGRMSAVKLYSLDIQAAVLGLAETCGVLHMFQAVAQLLPQGNV